MSIDQMQRDASSHPSLCSCCFCTSRKPQHHNSDFDCRSRCLLPHSTPYLIPPLITDPDASFLLTSNVDPSQMPPFLRPSTSTLMPLLGPLMPMSFLIQPLLPTYFPLFSLMVLISTTDAFVLISTANADASSLILTADFTNFTNLLLKQKANLGYVMKCVCVSIIFFFSLPMPSVILHDWEALNNWLVIYHFRLLYFIICA